MCKYVSIDYCSVKWNLTKTVEDFNFNLLINVTEKLVQLWTILVVLFTLFSYYIVTILSLYFYEIELIHVTCACFTSTTIYLAFYYDEVCLC